MNGSAITLDQIEILIAGKEHLDWVSVILETIENAAKIRGTGIAKRNPEYIAQKMLEGKAIVAFYKNELAGFCYIESWGNKTFVANSGLIVVDKFRGIGLAKAIKKRSFDHSRGLFPQAKLFGLTTGAAVMKINYELGYRPVTYAELTDDEAFWRGCQTCINYPILESKNRWCCMCTAMLYDPNEHKENSK